MEKTKVFGYVRVPTTGQVKEAVVLSTNTDIPSCPGVVVIEIHYAQGKLSSEAFLAGY